MRIEVPAPRILDFDVENRPLTYLGNDYNTGEVTAIAAKWIGGKAVWVYCLGETEPEVGLKEFRDLYDRADIVTGHYIRGYDLPVVNGMMLEYGFEPLGPKLTHDTKLDLRKSKYQSLSQESLAGMFELEQPKVHMTQADWREANRLTPAGIKKTRARVVGDIKQHEALRAVLIEAGWLGPAKVWSPEAKGSGYRP